MNESHLRIVRHDDLTGTLVLGVITPTGEMELTLTSNQAIQLASAILIRQLGPDMGKEIARVLRQATATKAEA